MAISVWLYGREPWPEAPVVLVTDEKEQLAQNSANLCMEMSGCQTSEIEESYPEDQEIQEALDLEDSLAGVQWVFVRLKDRCAIGVGSRKARYTRAARLGLALAHLTREGEVKRSRVRLCGLLESFQNARPLGDGGSYGASEHVLVLQDLQPETQPSDLLALEDVKAEPEPDVEPMLQDLQDLQDADPTDPWEELPDWALSDGASTSTDPLSIAAVESCRIRGEFLSSQVICRILDLSTQNMQRLLRAQGGVARINLNGRPWQKVVAGAPDHVRERLVGGGIQSCHLEVDEETRSSLPPYAPMPFFSFTRVDGSKAKYSPLDSATQVAPRSPRASENPAGNPHRNQPRPGRSRSPHRQQPTALGPPIPARGVHRPRPSPGPVPGPVPSGQPGPLVTRPRPGPVPSSIDHQPQMQDDEFELVTLEEEGQEEDEPLNIREAQVPSTALGPPQRQLLREAVQRHSWLLRPLDPALAPQAELRWGSLVQWVELDDVRLKCGHASISRCFSHGEHKGQPVHRLVIDLQMRRLRPQQLPALVAVRCLQRGELFVVCGNRRHFAVKEFAKSTPPWKRPNCWIRVIVHDFPQLLTISDPEQRMAFQMKAIQAVDGNGENPRLR